MADLKKTLWLWETLPKNSQGEPACPAMNKGDAMENVHRLYMSAHKPATFDQVFSGCQPPYTVQHDLDLLGDIVDLAKPGCKVKVVQVVRDDIDDSEQQQQQQDDDDNNIDNDEQPRLSDEKTLVKNLKLAGLVGVTIPKCLDPSSIFGDDPRSMEEDIRQHFQLSPEFKFKVVEVHCKTPDFVSGSTQLLSFADTIMENKKKRSLEENNIWNLDSLDDDDIDLVDQDALLDAEDLKKPDAASLRVCGTTGVRKACKDCSCGLAEELSGGKGSSDASKKTAGNSACGSCYLGDAFRCASCPYLGMPAFKPGEKIQLSTRQLNPDK